MAKEAANNWEELKKAQLDWSIEALQRAKSGCPIDYKSSFRFKDPDVESEKCKYDDTLARLQGSLNIKLWGIGHIEFEYESNGRERVVGGTVEVAAKLLVARLRSDADLIEKYFTNESTNQG